NLSIVGRSGQLLKELQSEIESLGRECLIIETDISLEEAPDRIVNETYKHFGRIDLLVNNAGMSFSGSVMKTDRDVWNKLFAVNACAPFFICQAAIPYLKKSDNPVIINMGSVVGFKGYINQAAYSSSKHALVGFTKVLAKEVQKDGIMVHVISPGAVNTEMVREMRPDIDYSELIQPEEIADIVEFLVTKKGKGTIDHIYIRRQSGLAFD
ncbi:MAG: SDR family NAD(P)-dependent oxidoreductase, partial [Prolixibacteraceae bacterium]|nr:SDR family NAD(P)-dependent oxidoreductase [Prolixibacteraceae bacterium]